MFYMFSDGDVTEDVHSVPSVKIPLSAECLHSSQFIELSCSGLYSTRERRRLLAVLCVVCKGERPPAQPWHAEATRIASVSSEPYSGQADTLVLPVRLYSCYCSFLSMYTRDER